MMYQGDVVMIAMAATALLVIALTIFAFQVFFSHKGWLASAKLKKIKREFSNLGATLLQ